VPQEKNNEVSGLTALSRNVGGSVGISFVTTLLARFSQRHQAMMIRHTVEGNGPFDRMRSALGGAWRHNGGGGPDSTLHAGAQIYGMMLSQARTLAYVDVIWILVALTGCLIPLPFLMNRPAKRAAAAEMVH
jgi:DHA2 family multidrug resistance protein